MIIMSRFPKCSRCKGFIIEGDNIIYAKRIGLSVKEKCSCCKDKKYTGRTGKTLKKLTEHTLDEDNYVRIKMDKM